jgi:GntR family transcriptional regulator/MocR family aminotransferase
MKGQMEGLMIDILLPNPNEGPIYMQLYKQIRELILNGVLSDGMKLPSVRSLQEQLRISKTTIESAYHQLLAEGYITSKPRSGFVVVHSHARLQSKATLLVPQVVSQFVQDVVDFNLLDVDRETFPSASWRSALTETMALYRDTLHQYGDPKGEYALRKMIAEYVRSSRGVYCSPEEIIIGTGISYSLFLLSRLIEQPATVAFEEASIAQVGSNFTQNGFSVASFQFYNQSLNITDLESKNVQVLYVTPSHRPSSQPLTFSMRQQLLDWAITNHAYIIEDDYDGEFRYGGKTIPALQGLDPTGVVIYIGTFSKAFTPALRMNYMVLPFPLVEKLQPIQSVLSCPSRMDQLAMKLFMERGHWYRHIKRIRRRYRKKYELLTQLIKQHLSPGVQFEEDNAGLHIELKVRAERDEETLINLALAEGVRVYGPQMLEQSSNRGYAKIYLGFGGVPMEDMERGILRLQRAWSGVSTFP